MFILNYGGQELINHGLQLFKARWTFLQLILRLFYIYTSYKFIV